MSEEELRASRARIASSAHAERRRIERALHDGVQQDLIALSVRLQLLAEAVDTDPDAALSLLDELQRETREALDRIRTLSSEIYPSLLEARGLPDALGAAGARVEGGVPVRFRGDVEAAVYFCCRALMDGDAVTIELREDGDALRVEIDCPRRIDLTAARDLVEARGGTLVGEATPNGGVRVVAAIPLG